MRVFEPNSFLNTLDSTLSIRINGNFDIIECIISPPMYILNGTFILFLFLLPATEIGDNVEISFLSTSNVSIIKNGQDIQTVHSHRTSHKILARRETRGFFFHIFFSFVDNGILHTIVLIKTNRSH